MDSKEISEIDKALAAAREKKAKREKLTGEKKATKEVKATKLETKAPAKKTARVKLTDEQKAEREQARAAERAVAKEARAKARAERVAKREAEKKAPHMKKIERAASRLPVLSETSQLMFNDVTANLAAADVAALALHLQHFNRVNSTQMAVGATKVAVGDQVTVVGGDPRFVGKTGVVSKAQRIRCYVTVEGMKKDLYLFISDVRVAEVAAETGTNG